MTRPDQSSDSAAQVTKSGSWQTSFVQALQLLDEHHLGPIGGSNPATIPHDSKRLQDALDFLNRSILKAPAEELARCHALRGYVHLLKADFDRAIDDCSEALVVHGAAPLRDPLENGMWIRGLNDKSKSKRPMSHDGSGWMNQHAEPLIWRACAEAGRENWLGAVLDLEHAVLADPDRSDEILVIREQVLRRALEFYREQAQRGLLSASNLTQRGKIYDQLGDFDRAIRDFRSSLELDPQNVEGQFGLARALASQGQLSQAQEAVDAGLHNAQDEQLKRGLILRSTILQSLGQSEQALSDLKSLKEQFEDDHELRLVIALQDCRLGNLPTAIDDLSWLLRHDRGHQRARALRAELYLELRNDDLATKDLHELFKRGLERAQWRVWRGQAHVRQRRWSEAADDFSVALEIDELCTDAYVGMAEASAGQGRKSLALSYCDRALRLDSRSVPAHFQRAHLLIESGKAKAAHAHLTRVIEMTEPSEIQGEAYYLRGTVESYLKRPTEALQDFNRALECRPMHPGTLIWRSNAYRGQKRWAEAIDDLELATRVNPVAADDYRRLADEVTKLTLEATGQNLLTGQDVARSHWLIGRAKQLSGDFAGACSDFRRSLAAQPQLWETIRDLTITLEKAQQLEDAYTVVSDFIGSVEAGGTFQTDFTSSSTSDSRADENRADSKSKRNEILTLAFVERARILMVKRQPRLALQDLNRAIEISSTCFEAWFARGEHGLRSQNFEQAIADLNKALELSPGNHLALACRGRVHYLNQNSLLAIQDFTQALDRFADQPDVHAARGLALLKNHQTEEAEKDFDAALAIDDNSLDAFTGKAIVLAKHEETEGALIWLTKALHRFDQPAAWAALLLTRGRIFYNASRFARAIADYDQVVDWDINLSETVAAIYARGVARLQEGDATGAQVDFESALAREPRFQPARLAVDWMNGAIRERPKALQPPKRVIRPTRPRVVAKPLTDLPDCDSWAQEPPFDQWVVRTDEMIEFGPCAKNVIDQWVREGRIEAETRLLRADWSAWKRAVQIYPFLSRPPSNENGREYREGSGSSSLRPGSGTPGQSESDHSEDTAIRRPRPTLSRSRLNEAVNQGNNLDATPTNVIETDSPIVASELKSEPNSNSVTKPSQRLEEDVDPTQTPKSHGDSFPLDDQRPDSPNHDSDASSS